MATVLITGTNRGIGLELVRRFVGRGDHVLAACRAASAELRATGATLVEGVDVTSGQAGAQLRAALGDQHLDVLLHNAGVMVGSSLGDLDADGMRRMFEVNALAPIRLTRALLGNLGEGSKVAIVTSRMGSIADNTSGGSYGYRMSKAAVNAGARSLSIDLRPRGVAVVLLHPGWVRTDMTGGRGLVDADESARGLVARIDALDLDSSGAFWHMNGETLPW